MNRKNAFTLIELLVVITIIVILISLLLPAVERAIGVAEEAVCKTHLRNIGMAAASFSRDRKGKLPSGPKTNGPNNYDLCWMGNEVWPGASLPGTLLPYLATGAQQAKKLYRCPSLQANNGAGSGSNGNFDYSMLEVFSGSRVTNIPINCEIRDPGTGEFSNQSTPLFVEEDPANSINTPANQEPGFDLADRLSTTHNKRGSYYAIDGSVTHYETRKGDLGPQAYDMFAVTPSGQKSPLINSGGATSGHGAWNNR